MSEKIGKSGMVHNLLIINGLRGKCGEPSEMGSSGPVVSGFARPFCGRILKGNGSFTSPHGFSRTPTVARVDQEGHNRRMRFAALGYARGSPHVLVLSESVVAMTESFSLFLTSIFNVLRSSNARKSTIIFVGPNQFSVSPDIRTPVIRMPVIHMTVVCRASAARCQRRTSRSTAI